MEHVTDIGEDYMTEIRPDHITITVLAVVTPFEPVTLDYEQNTKLTYDLRYTGITHNLVDLKSSLFYIRNFTSAVSSSVLSITGGTFNINGYKIDEELLGLFKFDPTESGYMSITVTSTNVNVNLWYKQALLLSNHLEFRWLYWSQRYVGCDCAQGKTKNAIIEQLTRNGQTSKPVVNVSSQLVVARCNTITIRNVEFRATSLYPDADYVVDYLGEEPLAAIITDNVFRYFPRGVFRHHR